MPFSVSIRSVAQFVHFTRLVLYVHSLIIYPSQATKSWCEKKHWIPQSDSSLKQKMNGKLCEDRISYTDHALYKEAQALIKEEKNDEAEADG